MYSSHIVNYILINKLTIYNILKQLFYNIMFLLELK